MSITDFLLERITEDEANAGRYVSIFPDGDMSPLFRRILAECEAKRAIIKTCIPIADEQDEYILNALAAVYADHPLYQDEWRVGA